MKETLINVSIEEILQYNPSAKSYENKLIIEQLDGNARRASEEDMRDVFVRLDAFSIFLIRRGTVDITIDNKTYHLADNYILHIMDLHIIKNIHLSADFQGYHIIIDRDFFCEVMLNSRRLPASTVASLHDRPVQHLAEEEGVLIEDCIKRIVRNIDRVDHVWRCDLIKNDLRGLMLEMSNIIYRANRGRERADSSGKDMLFFLFMQLLNTNCQRQHEVGFYARELGITPEYLSRILKSITGKTAAQWICEAIVREAEMRLQVPGSTVQSVSDILHFSDQSSFGKFFKKHKGISPLQYKIQNGNKNRP